MEMIIKEHEKTMERLAGLLLLRHQDVGSAQRPIDRKTAVARLDGAADAVARLLNAWGPEQILEQVEATATGWKPQEGTRVLLARKEELAHQLFLINAQENR